MRVQVRKCPFTGKIFDESRIAEYVLHLLDTREAMRQERELKRIKSTFKDWLKAEKLKITDPNMIPEWFMKNQRHIMNAFNAGCRSEYDHGFDQGFTKDDVFTKMEWKKSLTYSPMVSNSHSSPDGEKSNFMRDEKLPMGYPGWTGWVEGTLKRNKKNNGSYPYSSALNLVGIKTGSGGGGNENWGYDFRLWLADWPGLKEEVRRLEEEQILRKLKGK